MQAIANKVHTEAAAMNIIMMQNLIDSVMKKLLINGVSEKHLVDGAMKKFLVDHAARDGTSSDASLFHELARGGRRKDLALEPAYRLAILALQHCVGNDREDGHRVERIPATIAKKKPMMQAVAMKVHYGAIATRAIMTQNAATKEL